MTQTKKTKRFFLDYWKAMTPNPKKEETVRKFVSDEGLVQHILFFGKAFPDGILIPKEVIFEDDRFFARYIFKGTHTGEIDDIPPTLNKVNVPFAVGYRVEKDKIVDHWVISDQLELLQQLGLAVEYLDLNILKEEESFS